MKSSGDTFYEENVVIDEVTWRLSEGKTEDCQGLLKKTLGAVKYNQIYLDELKQEVGAS